MANLSIQEIMIIIGNKEIQITGRDKDIQELQNKIKELEAIISGEDKKKEKDNG
jgi:uncharacterized protein (DUF3084 family)